MKGEEEAEGVDGKHFAWGAQGGSRSVIGWLTCEKVRRLKPD